MATDTHTSIEELLETVFSMRSMLRLYSKHQQGKLVVSLVEAGSNTSTVALRVVGDDEKEVLNLRQ
jgi:hypothetical protein